MLHRILTFLLGAMTVSSCARPMLQKKQSDLSTDTQLEALVFEFFGQMRCRAALEIPDTIGYATIGDDQLLPGEEAGVCVVSSYRFFGASFAEHAAVYIDPQFKHSREVLRWIVYHELGHCVLKLGHTKDGIMRPGAPSPSLARSANWPMLVNELFRPCRSL